MELLYKLYNKSQ